MPLPDDPRSVEPTTESTSARRGRARELTRKPVVRGNAPDSGRRHHIGAAPAVLAVRRADGTVSHTRSTPGQLADQTAVQLERLAERLAGEMAAAAAQMDFESAAEARDDMQAIRRELARRTRS